MISVAFVCLGNICRSPMAQLVFQDMIEKQGLSGSFTVDSFATSDEQVGNPIYPSIQKVLAEHGIFGKHYSKQLSLRDIKNFDYILVMDSSNLKNVLRLTGGQYGDKIAKLCDYTSRPRDVADPWFTRNFEVAYNDVLDGCTGFLNYVMQTHAEQLSYDKRH